MKNTTLVRTVPKSNRENVERCKIDTSNKELHDANFSYLEQALH